MSAKNRFLTIALASLVFGFCSTNTCRAIETNSKRLEEVREGSNIAAPNQTPTQKGLSSQQILKRVGHTYSECKEYQDSGKSITEFTREDGSRWSHNTVFRTAMRRGNDTLEYRFAYRKNYFGKNFSDETILWHDGHCTMVSDEEPANFKKEESLGRATAGLTGISSGTAHYIPVLLMPQLIRGRKLTEFSAHRPPKQEKLGKNICYRLDGLYANDKISLWIEKDTFLILKIVTGNGEPTIQTITYIPKIDEKIPDRFFGKHVKGEWEEIEPIAPKEKPVAKMRIIDTRPESILADDIREDVDYAYLCDKYVCKISAPPHKSDISRRELVISNVKSDAHNLAATYPDKRMLTILEILSEISESFAHKAEINPNKIDVNKSIELPPLKLSGIYAAEVLVTMEFVFDIELSKSEFKNHSKNATPTQLFELVEKHIQ
ncbi:hypothetical protein [Bythopirellula polymerisocia]|uniref:Uncharacterized protein n=1 Tax=Bythopirellula polymerisocia TaxID=2528003 RepID=A0A5C6D055_9BACT|nr:hypothetical protein [Bythopirellula polymerisocia]TWU30078.1 hypothetical protein Pla144_08640 [Bythopirellula polymerisocia]